jgi:hypothetical protein
VVSDLGNAYRVEAGGLAKTYADAARHCDRRARIAAAFIALALAPEASSSTPPEDSSSANGVVPPPAPASPPPTTSPPEAPPPPRENGPWGRLDVRGAFAEAPELGIAAGGAALRAAVGVGAFGAEVRCGWLTSTSASLPGRPGSFSLERWPCAIGAAARLTPPTWPVEIELAAGVALGVVRISGHDLFMDETATRLEAGARVGVDAAFRLGKGPLRFAPLLGVDAVFLPAVYQVNVQGTMPAGAIAETPRVWLGVTAGACWALQ